MRLPLVSTAAVAVALLIAGTSMAAPPRSVLKDGAACEPGGAKACEAGLYCKREYGACVAVPKGEGACSPIPDICTDDYKPVCGCNGKTYPNACHAEIDDANIAHEGSCNSSDAAKERR